MNNINIDYNLDDYQIDFEKIKEYQNNTIFEEIFNDFLSYCRNGTIRKYSLQNDNEIYKYFVIRSLISNKILVKNRVMKISKLLNNE